MLWAGSDCIILVIPINIATPPNGDRVVVASFTVLDLAEIRDIIVTKRIANENISKIINATCPP